MGDNEKELSEEVEFMDKIASLYDDFERILRNLQSFTNKEGIPIRLNIEPLVKEYNRLEKQLEDVRKSNSYYMYRGNIDNNE